MTLWDRIFFFKGLLPVAQMVKNLPAIWETQVLSLDQEDPLKESMVSHSSSLAWRIPKKEEPGGLQSLGLQRVWDMTEHTLTHDTKVKENWSQRE